jgi:uncharacterized protein (TIGR02246 family)
MTHADVQAIRALLARYLECWRRADIENWSDLFTEDSDFISWSGLWWRTRDQVIAGHRAVTDFIRAQQARYQFESCQIHPLAPTVALVHALWFWPDFKERQEAQPEDRAGILTMVLIRTESGWRIRASQNTRRLIAAGERP